MAKLFPNNHEPINITIEEMHQITRGLGYKGMVKDVDTNKIYRVYGASCGSGNCNCAVTIEEVEQRNSAGHDALNCVNSKPCFDCEHPAKAQVYYSVRTVLATSKDEAVEKIIDEEFDEENPLCDEVLTHEQMKAHFKSSNP